MFYCFYYVLFLFPLYLLSTDNSYLESSIICKEKLMIPHLWHPISRNQTMFIETLIKKGFPFSTHIVADDQNALHYAVMDNKVKPQMITLLIEKGKCDPHAKTSIEKDTVAHLLCHRECYTFKGKKRAEKVITLLKEYHVNFNALNSNKVSPLETALMRGNKGIVHLLLNAGADGVTPQKDGSTMLHAIACIASSFVDNDIMNILNVNNSINIQNSEGDTPMHILAREKNHSYLSTYSLFFAQKNVDLTIENNEGETPISIALELPNHPFLEALGHNNGYKPIEEYQKQHQENQTFKQNLEEQLNNDNLFYWLDSVNEPEENPEPSEHKKRKFENN